MSYDRRLVRAKQYMNINKQLYSRRNRQYEQKIVVKVGNVKVLSWYDLL